VPRKSENLDKKCIGPFDGKIFDPIFPTRVLWSNFGGWVLKSADFTTEGFVAEEFAANNAGIRGRFRHVNIDELFRAFNSITSQAVSILPFISFHILHVLNHAIIRFSFFLNVCHYSFRSKNWSA
jgi:hypothetical protein